MKIKAQQQESQYAFPYHYIAHRLACGSARRVRTLQWGLEYLCYQSHIAETVHSLKPESVLEVGCGDGYFIGSLGDKISQRMGADLSERAIAFAKAFNPDVEFYPGDVADIERRFDVVAAIEVLEHIPDEHVNEFLNRLFNRAHQGGHVVISVPSTVMPVHDKHYRHYTQDLLVRQIHDAVPGVEVVKVESVCYVPAWMQLLNRLCINKYWTFELGFLAGWQWRKIWYKHRVSSEGKGRHVVALCRLSDACE